MNLDNSLSRRAFIEKAATITAIGFAAPHLATGAEPVARPKPGPNSRIHLGIIGCGGMGRANLGACAGQPDVVVTAACDVWPSRRDAVVQQFKDTCKGYSDFRELLRQPDLDAVIIATPPHWHALQLIAALDRGLDVYCEKPLSYDIREGRAMVNAVNKSGRIVQIGFQRRQSPAFQAVRQHIQSGNAGRIVCAEAVIHYTAGTKDATPQPPPASLDPSPRSFLEARRMFPSGASPLR